MYIDTHVHLNDEKLYDQIEQTIKDAQDNDVKMFFVVGWDLDSSKKAIEIAEKYPNAFAIIGYHPCNIKGFNNSDVEWLLENGKNERVIAIGEIGYDLHWDTTTFEEQQVAFEKQIEIAKLLHKPISIHSRDAISQTLETIRKCNAKEVGGVIHSFSGSKEMADLFIKENFVLGISGPVTFKNNVKTKEVIEHVDIKYIISETDSPYLTPHPYRGKTNGPKYIPLIVEEIARLKNENVEIIKKQIFENALRVFNICKK